MNLENFTSECKSKILKEINHLDNLFEKEKAKREFFKNQDSFYACCTLKTYDAA